MNWHKVFGHSGEEHDCVICHYGQGYHNSRFIHTMLTGKAREEAMFIRSKRKEAERAQEELLGQVPE